MTTASDLVQETRRYLMSGQREPLNQVSGSVSAGATTVTLARDTANITAGAHLAIDLEILYVWSANPTAKTVTVQRGILGSTPATHADGALVTLNPRFSDFAIFAAVNTELDDLSPELFQVLETTLQYNAAIQGYDLAGATDVFDVLRVRHNLPGPSKVWPEIRSWQLKRNQSTVEFASGFELVLYEAGWPGLDVRVTYSAPFTHFTDLTTDLTVTGLPASAADIPPLGAAARLSGVREVMRNFTESQGNPRRAQEVPTNAQQAGAQALLRMKQQRIVSEVASLRRDYPHRRRVA